MAEFGGVWKSGALVQTFLEGVRGGIPFAAEQLEVMLRLLAARGAPVERFADLGCGDGILSRALLARYPHARGVLLDFSEPMLDQARAKLGADLSRVQLAYADLGKPDWAAQVRADAPLDAVVSAFAIHHLPDSRKRELYREILGLLKPGGFFINIEHVASASPWIEAVWDEMFMDRLWRYHTDQGTGKSREEIAREYVHRPDKAANILATVETQCVWLRELGFLDVDCYFKSFELAVFGGRAKGAA